MLFRLRCCDHLRLARTNAPRWAIPDAAFTARDDHRALGAGSFGRSSARHFARRARRSRLLPVLNVGLPSVIRTTELLLPQHRPTSSFSQGPSEPVCPYV